MAYKKIEKFDDDTTSGLITSYKQILKLLGQDTEREGLAKTPERLAKAMQYLTHGYDLDATEILNALKDTLQPLGVAVVIEASHLCMMMRGVQKQNSVTTTSAFWGEFEKNETRSEFTKLISSHLH